MIRINSRFIIIQVGNYMDKITFGIMYGILLICTSVAGIWALNTLFELNIPIQVNTVIAVSIIRFVLMPVSFVREES